MIRIEKIWLTDTAVWIRTVDGQQACEEFADYPRLKYATPEQRRNYTSDEVGIHWPALDEDLSFEGFFRPRHDSGLYGLFMAHPELNASAVARRLGMAQSLLAQYISGTKKPSAESEALIRAEIRKIGDELARI